MPILPLKKFRIHLSYQLRAASTTAQFYAYFFWGKIKYIYGLTTLLLFYSLRSDFVVQIGSSLVSNSIYLSATRILGSNLSNVNFSVFRSTFQGSNRVCTYLRPTYSIKFIWPWTKVETEKTTTSSSPVNVQRVGDRSSTEFVNRHVVNGQLINGKVSNEMFHLLQRNKSLPRLFTNSTFHQFLRTNSEI